MPVYVDSPLAADITGVYESHPECLDDEGRQMLADGVGILGGDVVTYIREFEDSIRISRRPDPCDRDRVERHVRRRPHPAPPEGARRRPAVHGHPGQLPGVRDDRPAAARKVADGEVPRPDWNKWIEVVHLDGFSGHADRADFLAYLGPLAGKVGKVRLIHGEREQAESLAEALRDIGFADVGVPSRGTWWSWALPIETRSVSTSRFPLMEGGRG